MCNEHIHHENKVTQMTTAMWLPLSCDVCLIQITSFDLSSLITVFAALKILLVSVVEQELRTRPEHMSSPPVVSVVRVSYIFLSFFM
jgi:hypothetical protein